MEEYYFGVPLTNSKTLCIGPITREEANANDPQVCDGLGFYLYVVAEGSHTDGIEVLAKLVSEEAASRLSNLLRAASPATFALPIPR